VTGAWNHNTHHHRLLLTLVPQGGGAALDVGCGDGSFAEALAERYSRVVALDPDPAQVAVASARCAHLPHVSVVRADFLTSNLPDNEFDVVTALAAFHHMPFADAAREARRLLTPGGRLIILGVWTDNGPRDLLINVASTALNWFLGRRHGRDTMTVPATLERTSWVAAQVAAAEHVPGARMRRRLLWRYTLVWDKPSSA
jgi:ubiquinone/menaquinone biosynthesis C-methylase UbiE